MNLIEYCLTIFFLSTLIVSVSVVKLQHFVQTKVKQMSAQALIYMYNNVFEIHTAIHIKTIWGMLQKDLLCRSGLRKRKYEINVCKLNIRFVLCPLVFCSLFSDLFSFPFTRRVAISGLGLIVWNILFVVLLAAAKKVKLGDAEQHTETWEKVHELRRHRG